MDNTQETEFPLIIYELKKHGGIPYAFHVTKSQLNKLKALTIYDTSWRPNIKYLFWTHTPYTRADDEEYGELKAYFQLEDLKTPAIAVTTFSQGYIRTPAYFQDDADRMELVITNREHYYFRLLLKRGVNNERRSTDKANTSRRVTRKTTGPRPENNKELHRISHTERSTSEKPLNQ
jgi:hypothetical protein